MWLAPDCFSFLKRRMVRVYCFQLNYQIVVHFFIHVGVDEDADTDEVAPGTENLVAPGAESSVTSQVHVTAL